MIPQIKEDYNILGDFEFTKSKLIMDDENIPYLNITFKWSPECPQSINNIKAIELIAEKLKQDFLKQNI